MTRIIFIFCVLLFAFFTNSNAAVAESEHIGDFISRIPEDKKASKFVNPLFGKILHPIVDVRGGLYFSPKRLKKFSTVQSEYNTYQCQILRQSRVAVLMECDKTPLVHKEYIWPQISKKKIGEFFSKKELKEFLYRNKKSKTDIEKEQYFSDNAQNSKSTSVSKQQKRFLLDNLSVKEKQYYLLISTGKLTENTCEIKGFSVNMSNWIQYFEMMTYTVNATSCFAQTDIEILN